MHSVSPTYSKLSKVRIRTYVLSFLHSISSKTDIESLIGKIRDFLSVNKYSANGRSDFADARIRAKQYDKSMPRGTPWRPRGTPWRTFLGMGVLRYVKRFGGTGCGGV